MLLNFLLEEYENFSIAMESRDNIPTLEILKAKFEEEEARTTEMQKCLTARVTH